jgi:MFS family permease
MPKTLIQSWPLFSGIAIIMIGNGLQGTLLGVRAASEGFDIVTTGLIMSIYYLGFLFGSILTPRLVSNVGHIRVFAAFASLASTTVLLQAVFPDPLVWILSRGITGGCFAALYVVIESWLNGMVSNKDRGKILASYLIIHYFGIIIGQLLMNVADPAGMELFVLVSVLISISLLPLSLSKRESPKIKTLKRIKAKKVYQSSPLGFIGIIIAGMTSGSIFTITPVFAKNINLSVAEISFLMSAITFGALLSQYPIGILSDKFDRRIILNISCLIASILAVVSFYAASSDLYILIISASLFWAFGGPLYSLSTAQMNDHLNQDELVAASGTMMLFNGAGAFLGPLILTMVMKTFGDYSFFLVLSGCFLLMFFFGILRTFISDPVPEDEQTDFVLMPPPTRSSPMVAKIMKDIIIQDPSNEK